MTKPSDTNRSPGERTAQPTRASGRRPLREPAGRPPKRPLWRRLLRPALAIGLMGLGAVAAVLLFHFLIMPLFVRHGQDATVPDVRGLALADARPILRTADLTEGGVRHAHDDHIPPGRILRQNPPPDYRVKRGREVDLVVSLGAEELRVPLVTGETAVHARFVLAREGLTVGRVREVPVGEVEADHVVASAPRPGALMAGRHAVDLLVSAGDPARTFLMPDVRGLDVERVTAVFEPLGLTVHRRVRPGARRQLDVVADQSPLPGEPVRTGGAIELTTGG